MRRLASGTVYSPLLRKLIATSGSLTVPSDVLELHLSREKKKPATHSGIAGFFKLRGQDLNLRPSGYEPDELPGCSTPRNDST